MSQWSLLVFATCVLGAFAVPVIDDPIAFMNATWNKCQKQEKVPDDAMEDLYFFKSVEGIKDHKCVIKCIDEEYGIYQQDGTISQEMIVRAIKGLWKDPQIQEKLISASAECLDSANPDPDPCQYTFDKFDCFVQAVNKEGISIHEGKTN
ncbi:unnamed protein product [Nezara viridula]|uniref:Odorant binding protein 21 n=1 Tax=Nezara viridula TaxID=85310 RepID=A0A4Y5RGJ7_NEZVI|nr:odorant binding protein 21 [Nezara viridula]CAH1391410.1 unnamed protein product [Nezara viridula]